MNRKSSLVVVGYLLLVFLAGIAVGGFADHLYVAHSAHARPTPEQYRRRLLAELQKRLNLQPAQITQLNGIFDATGVRFRDIHKSIEPDLAALRTEHDDKVRAILNDQQRAEYDRWRAERDKQHAAERH
jgi:Spy/CpxP family protein refolding chaperone